MTQKKKKKKGEIKLQEKKIYTDKGEKEVYRWSPCLWHQLSCCIPLCPLYVEPRVGKAQAKRLERDSRSRRNFRQVYSLLVGTAAITQPLSRLAQRTYCSSLLSWLTHWTQPWDSSNFPYFMAGAHIDTYRTQLMTNRVPHDAHVRCYKWFQLLHSRYLQNVGQESLDTPSWPICSLPTLHPFRVSRSRSMRRPSVILLWPVTLTLGFTSGNSRSYNSSYIPNTEQSPTPGITWDPCCSPCPHGARRVTHCTWSAFIVHGQSSPLSVLVRLEESLHRGNSIPAEFLLRTHKTPHRHQAHPARKGCFVVPVHSPPTRLHFTVHSP